MSKLPLAASVILYALMHYDRGLAVATVAFTEEGVAKNPAFAEALQWLKSQFQTENAPGPVRAAYFVFGEVLASESEDMWLRRLQVQQDAVSLASVLLAG